jgi:hypothetical protein
VRAILSRESDPDDVLSAIYASYDGLVLLSTPTAESLAALFGDQPLEVEAELSEEITSRETDVLRMLAEGLSTKILRLVSVSPSIRSSSTSARFSTNWVLPPAPKRLPWESGAG